MVVGGLWALIRLWGSLMAGIGAGLRAYQAGGEQGPIPRTARDTPMSWVGVILAVSVLPLFFVFNAVTGNAAVSLFMAVVMLVAGFLFSAVASYMAGLVGSSNNPISGVTIATILTSALLLLLLLSGQQQQAIGASAAILIGAVVCCAAAIGGDNMQDLKAGQLVGATPWKQQVMQGVGVLAASVASGVFDRDLPWNMVVIGMLVAVAIIILDLFLERRGSVFRTPVLAVAVGIYLPLELSVPILAGGLISLAAHRWHARRIAAEAEGELRNSLIEAQVFSQRAGLLFAAGLITGEAVLGILLAIPIVIFKGENPMDLSGVDALASYLPASWPGVVLLAGVMAALYAIARGRSSR
jgi:uncharacterized oligopeptide transporter (OPT) family protein